MKSLIIAEKPSVASDLAKALGRVPRKGDYYEGEEYIITSAIGHLVELCMPEDLDKRYSFWRLEDLPILPEKFKLKPIEKTQEKFREVASLIARKDVGTVINACDAGREGELIFTYIYDLAGAEKPVQRLWMSSMTPAGIRQAFSALREGSQMRHLADAARCRSEADWLVGLNGTRAITKRLFGSRKGVMATVGRVQTPTLAIVLEREREIRAFQPRVYSRVVARFHIHEGEYEGVYLRPDYKRPVAPANGRETVEQDRAEWVWDKARAEAVAAHLRQHPRADVSDESKRATQASPRLYDLTSLQREANNRYGFPARRTLQIAQALYERHKVITYPRTDSRALPEDYPPTVLATLESLGGDLGELARPVVSGGWVRPGYKRVFNNAEVTDHFAIIPTTERPGDLDEAEAKIYDMIARRFVAAFYPAAQFDVTTRSSRVGEHLFRSEGRVLAEAGWLAVYGKSATPEGEKDAKSLPALVAADGRPAHAKVAGVEVTNEATKPPPRYTEATLLSAMENAGKFVDDEDLADAMSERGLGTPATRASIIEHLISEKYLTREQRELVPSAKAENVIDFLSTVKAEALTSPALTGEWEFKLRKVEHGQLSRTEFMAGITDLTRAIVSNTKSYTDSRESARTLPWTSFTDGQPMLEYDRKWASQDGKLEIYKTTGNRRFEEAEVRLLVEQKRLGPLDNFVSQKSGRKFSAILQLVADEKGVWKPKFLFDNGGGAGGSGPALNFDELQPIGKCPRSGEPVYETPASYVVRHKENGQDKLLYRLPRNLLGRDIPREQYFKYLETGRTELIDKFWSRRTRRPFSAILAMKADGSGFDFEFPERPARAGKAGGKGARASSATKASPPAAPAPAETKKPAATPSAKPTGKKTSARTKAKAAAPAKTARKPSRPAKPVPDEP